MGQAKEKAKKAPGKMGIRVRLIAVIIPIVLILIISFFELSRMEIKKLSREKLSAQSRVCAGEIYAWTDRILAELQVYKDTIEEGGFRNDAEILKYMETSVGKNDAYPIGLYMGDDKGVYLDGSGWVPGDDWVLVERDWYLEGKEHEKLAFGEPYYDSQSGDICVSATVRMNDPGAVRVLAVDVYLNYLSEIVSEMGGESGSRSFLVTEGSQTILADPDTSLIDVRLGEQGLDRLYGNVGGAISEGKRGILELKGDSGLYYVCLNEIPGTDWLLVSCLSRESALADLVRLEVVMVLITLVAAAVLIFATLRMMDRVVKPVARVTDVIQKVSEGDFSQDIEVRGSDEIARMGAQTKEFLVQMRETISGITETARWLENQSEENDRVSGSLTDSSRSQREAMETLNSLVEELSGSVGKVSEQMNRLADMVGKADEQGKHVGGIMRQTVEISGSGREAADKVSEGMDRIEKSIVALSEQIMQTDAAMGQIGSMVEMIMNVAEETNLLSLNASIEAARAGEAGRGFAVVAAQVGKLAESSSTAADDIARLTAEIQDAMQQAIVKMEDSVGQVKGNAVLVRENSATFGTVFERVRKASEAVEQMAALMDRAGTVAAEMLKIAESQVAETNQITQSAQELDGYTRVVGEGSDTVAQNAKELERKSRDLMERVGRFRV